MDSAVTAAYAVDAALMLAALARSRASATPRRARARMLRCSRVSRGTLRPGPARGARRDGARPVLGPVRRRTALLPVFADAILHVGPEGLGVLRAAPAAGAVVMSLVLAHRPPLRRAGRTLLERGAVRGLDDRVRSVAELLALAGSPGVSGMVDTVSVVVRARCSRS